MKKIIKFIKKTLAILAVIITIALITFAGIKVYEESQPITVINESARESTVLEQVKGMTNSVEKMENDVEEARKMLEEATKKLDEEEARLNSEIQEREEKIAEINDIRSSF